MATPSSIEPVGRVGARRQGVIDDAVSHAVDIVTSDGVGAVSVSEIARRMGIKGPSLYKYFPSLHAIYDALFARGNAQLCAFVDASVEGVEPGLARLLEASRAVLRWSVANPGYGQLMFWRPVPGFVPSPESFAPSQSLWERFRTDLATAASSGELRPEADSDEAMRMLTVVISGVGSQHMANDPDADYDSGVFSGLTDEVLRMYVNHYAPGGRA